MQLPLTRVYRFDEEEDKMEKLLVVGDIHGDIKSLKNALAYRSSAGEMEVGMLFLGDYADRGSNGLEVVETLRKLSYSDDKIILLKGNHENYTKDGRPTFWPCDLPNEVEMKLGRSWKDYWNEKLRAFFDRLYLAAKLNNILFVHGGIHSKLESLNELEDPTSEIEEDILWSDPVSEQGVYPSPRGAGRSFGPDISMKVCDNLKIDYILRSHEPRKAFYEPFIEHDGRIVTISSTTVYGGKPHIIELNPRNLPTNGYELRKSFVYL